MAEFILAITIATQVPYIWHDSDPVETQESYDLLDDSERCDILKDQEACDRANQE